MRPLAIEAVPERPAVDERHRVEEESAGLAGIDQGQDMRVREARDDLDFAHESRRAERHREVGMQDLHCDRPFVPDVLGR